MTAIKIPHGAWLLVGDGQKALIFRNEGDEEQAKLEVERVLEHDDPPTREQGTDAPGRFNRPGIGGSPGAGTQTVRHSVQNTDWHRLEKDRFAAELAERLYKAAHRNEFDKLVVVAPPHILGELRKQFHKEVQDRIIAEIDKDLTNQPPYKIEQVLTGR